MNQPQKSVLNELCMGITLN